MKRNDGEATDGVAAKSGVIRIGTVGKQTKTYIAGIVDSKLTGSEVVITASGQLGVKASSERYKTDIAPMGSVSEKLRSLDYPVADARHRRVRVATRLWTSLLSASGTLAAVGSAQSSVRERDKRSAQAAPTIGRVSGAPYRRNRGMWLALVASD
jgi:hypothetical protein